MRAGIDISSLHKSDIVFIVLILKPDTSVSCLAVRSLVSALSSLRLVIELLMFQRITAPDSQSFSVNIVVII